MRSKAVNQTGYDRFAWFYRKHWCAHYHSWALAVLERIFLPRIPAHAQVLDVCCGAGTLAARLHSRGYRITGVDCSREMIAIARREAPRAAFLRADIREFCVPAGFDAAICTFDSLNHLLAPHELRAAFHNVCQSLRPGGCFAFDMNLEAAYLEQWSRTCTVVEPDNAFFVRGEYDAGRRLGRTEITTFRLLRKWSRSDMTLLQRYYPTEEIHRLARAAGFCEVIAYDVPQDLGIEGPPGHGRAFFLAVK